MIYWLFYSYLCYDKLNILTIYWRHLHLLYTDLICVILHDSWKSFNRITLNMKTTRDFMLHFKKPLNLYIEFIKTKFSSVFCSCCIYFLSGSSQTIICNICINSNIFSPLYCIFSRSRQTTEESYQLVWSCTSECTANQLLRYHRTRIQWQQRVLV